jgi:hypothetical protein
VEIPQQLPTGACACQRQTLPTVVSKDPALGRVVSYPYPGISMNKILVALLAGFISIAASAQAVAPTPAPAPAAPSKATQPAVAAPAQKKSMAAKKPVQKTKNKAAPAKKAKAKPAKKAA